jgi:hypothetical protein
MSEEMRTYVGCFTFDRTNEDDDDHFEVEVSKADSAFDGFNEGRFQIVVEANHRDDALARCRARLTDLALGPNPLGPIVVYLEDLIELPHSALSRGVLFRREALDGEGNRIEDPLPTQGVEDACRYSHDDFPELRDQQESEEAILPPFWDGCRLWESAWKLYWCTTDDHNEDCFVVARSTVEATRFFEESEGYEEDYASAEFVCLLPQPRQEGTEQGWPDSKLLEECGAEILTVTPQDGGNERRRQMGITSQLIRINGRIFAEGDSVGNAIRRVGTSQDDVS